ncbi:hypothetical protein OH76DRAFT_1490380 [Lentinus brumalis]|uniref:Ribonuclease H1 N-terminal domain-containing protein n=1 Tax=Lentinus brumalis TaxID=2498619 RepID=A0A371CJ49_9APHY|nr:hypothetical protein OH76DRAFT_1490380 [Polyporus brumalis]
MNQLQDLARAQERHYNLIAFNLGATPIYDERGKIIPIGEQVGRDGRVYKTYVVWRGRCVGIFFSWGTTAAMVNFFPGAAYQSFKTLDEAHRAWVNGPGFLPGWVPPAVARDPIITPAGLPQAVVDDTQQAAGGTNSPPSPPAPTISLPSSSTSVAPSSTIVSARGSISASTSPQCKYGNASMKVAGPISMPRSAPPPCPRKSRSPMHTPDSRSAVGTPRSGTQSIATTTTSSIVVSEGRAYAVVVGDVPGVYVDKDYILHDGRQASWPSSPHLPVLR